MFSASVEAILHIAYREAVSRRHAYLTLEHLLYALLHDTDGERILAACGANLPLLRRRLNEYLDEAHVGDVLAAILQQPKAHAAILLAEQGVTRLDVLEFISHGVAKTPFATPGIPSETAGTGTADDPSGTSRDPLEAYCDNLTARSREGRLDPLIGRSEE